MLTPDHMPGPTAEARAVQHKQYSLLQERYDAWNDAYAATNYTNRDAASKDPRYVRAKSAYDTTVSELVAMLGSQAHCNAVDCDLFSLYSDLYKEDNGFRPRHHVTLADVQAYLDATPSIEAG